MNIFDNLQNKSNYDINSTLVPYVIEKTPGGERSYDIYSRLLKDRIIMLTEEVTSASASVIIGQLLVVESHEPVKDISFYINSPGGSVTAGLAIVDTMNYIKCPVSTICIGMAASMGSLLLSCGTKGRRFATPNSEVMIHQPLIAGGGISGQATDIQIHSDHIIKMKEKLNKMLSDNSGKPLEQVKQDTERDKYLTAEEALEYGLIDGILEKR